MTKTLEGEFGKPFGIACSDDGVVYVSEPCTNSIHVLSGYGRQGRKRCFIGTDGGKILRHPLGIATDSHGRILVCDSDENLIKIFDRNGEFDISFGKRDLLAPSGVCVDKLGNVIVANSGGHQLVMYDSEGNFLQYLLTFPENGIRDPKGVSVSPTGQLAVVSWEDSRCSLYQITDT